MGMVPPPLVIDLQTEVIAGMVGRDGGLRDDDMPVGRDVFHDQDSAVIMLAHATCLLYAICNVQVLGRTPHYSP
jgi:hypothetical protein